MLKERLATAQEIATQLADAERTNDLALIATARLAATMLEGRIRLNLAAQVGQEAFAAVASTFASQSSGRAQLVTAHSALNGTRHVVGLDDWDFGGGGNKQVPSGHLTVIKRVA